MPTGARPRVHAAAVLSWPRESRSVRRSRALALGWEGGEGRESRAHPSHQPRRHRRHPTAILPPVSPRARALSLSFSRSLPVPCCMLRSLLLARAGVLARIALDCGTADRSALPPFRPSALPPFRRSAVPSFHRPHRHTVPLLCGHTVRAVGWGRWAVGGGRWAVGGGLGAGGWGRCKARRALACARTARHRRARPHVAARAGRSRALGGQRRAGGVMWFGVSGSVSVVRCQWVGVSGSVSVVRCQWFCVRGGTCQRIVSGSPEEGPRHHARVLEIRMMRVTEWAAGATRLVVDMAAWSRALRRTRARLLVMSPSHARTLASYVSVARTHAC